MKNKIIPNGTQTRSGSKLNQFRASLQAYYYYRWLFHLIKQGFIMFLIKLHLEKDCFLALLWEDFAYWLGCAAPLRVFHQWVNLIKQAAEQHTEVTYVPSVL